MSVSTMLLSKELDEPDLHIMQEAEDILHLHTF